jgi:hypothetical protein
VAYGKSTPVAKAPGAAAAPVYPRTITFAGPKSKRSLKKQGKKSGRL